MQEMISLVEFESPSCLEFLIMAGATRRQAKVNKITTKQGAKIFDGISANTLLI